MNLSSVFINRPVATTLLTLALALAGLLAFFQLPVAPIPQVDFPTLSVTANLAGANPEVMAATVATPLERSLGRIAGVTEMTSTSSFGASRITLQFDLSRDVDGAARDVQAAINAAQSLLPTGLPNRPTYRKMNPSDAPIMVLALTSETMSRAQLYDVASTILAQKISQVEGIGSVNIGGSSLPAVRVELNPLALSKYGISFAEVRTVLANTNVNRPKGVLESDEKHWQIALNDQAKQAKDYESLIIAYRNNAPVHLSDVGIVLDSSEDVRSAGFFNGKKAVVLVLFKQAGANIIATVDKIKTLLPQLQASIPSAAVLSLAIDRSLTIRASLHEVELSLCIAVVLVILVVFLFLRNLRASMIPIITVPMSLIGTFAAMYLLDYSLDNLSLMALTVATGFVVDDAIVVLENTMRHLEEGMERRKAALLGAKEVGFTVLTMSVSLIAVFIPILFMGGMVGRLFQEFAVTLAVSVLVSLVLSLTTAPMLCALWLQPAKQEHGSFYHFFERGFNHLTASYQSSLAWALHHRRIMMLLLMVTIGFNVYLYMIVPKGFFPTQDTGRLMASVLADQSVSSTAMQDKLARFVKLLSEDPDINYAVGFSGGTGGGGPRLSNNAQIFAALKPLNERKSNLEDLLTRLRKKSSQVAGAKLYLQAAQELRAGGRGSASLFEYALEADSLEELREWSPKLTEALQKRTELEDVNSDQQDRAQEISLEIDREAAARLGVTQAAINATLNDAFGQRQISIIYTDLNQYHVVMESAPEYAQNADTLKSIYINTQSGTVVPLSAFASYNATNTPLSVNHQGLYPTATVSFNLKAGKSLSDATKIIEDTMKQLNMPSSIHGSFQGSAKAFQQSQTSQPLLILAALIVIYIVLGMLYESLVHPLTILSTLPSAGVGAILALLAFKTEFSLIALIGVILLIGIVKKNAIMMIDFALTAERKHGLPPEAAILQACVVRFRPIMMTTMAALLAALPLALGTGYGAELRKPLGITIVGGLLVSQWLTLYTTPVVYLYMARFQTFCRRLFS